MTAHPASARTAATSTAATRTALIHVIRTMFPPGSFPDPAFAQAADEVLEHGWAREVLRAEIGQARDLGTWPELTAHLVRALRDSPLYCAVSDAAVRAVLGTARSERARADTV